MVLQPPRVPILETTHWCSPQRHTVPPSSKACSYQILTVPPTTPAGMLALTGAVGVHSCAAVSTSPPQGVGRQCAEASELSNKFEHIVSTR